MNDWSVTFSLPQGPTVGGLTSWALRLASALSERGRRVNLVFHEPPAGYRGLASLLPTETDRLRCVAAPSLSSPEDWSTCVQRYRGLLPTILLPAVHSQSYAIAAALAGAQADGLRVLGWNHSDNPYDYAYLAYYEPLIHRYIANTRHCRNQLAERLPSRISEIDSLPHGVDVQPPMERPPLTGRPTRLIYAGRFDHLVKRVLDLPDLAERLDRRGVRFEMRIIGDGPQRDRLQQAADTARSRFGSTGDSIRVEPSVTPAEMPAAWSWADVSMLPSVHEGMSVALLEAMSAGCVPVISRVASGAEELIEHGRNGMLFPVGDVAAMAECISALAGDARMLARMSAEARQTIIHGFTFDRHVKRVRDLLLTLAQEPPRWWPPARPIAMNRGADDASTAGSVPGHAASRLRRALDRIAQADGGPVVIYGAGRHTRSLADVLADSPVEISGIVDDDPGFSGRSLWGWPIVEPEQIARTAARTVLISSWLHESAMLRRAARFEPLGLKVVGLYAEPQRAPAPAGV